MLQFLLYLIYLVKTINMFEFTFHKGYVVSCLYSICYNINGFTVIINLFFKSIIWLHCSGVKKGDVHVSEGLYAPLFASLRSGGKNQF